MEKNYVVTDDHIGIFENYFEEDLIDKYLEFYKICESSGLTYSRQETNDAEPHVKKDKAISILATQFYQSNGEILLPYTVKPFMEQFFSRIYPLYVEKYSTLSRHSRHTIFDIKIQKTEPAEGYHIWHAENENHETRNRIMSFILYLNDVDQGGETEFLYQKARVEARRNRLVLWPAGYTHLHRGNPPLSGTKYILTGWVEYGMREN
jgi:hypothetical protein